MDLIDPGESRADASVGAGAPMSSAAAAAGQPPIFTRAEWGADESLRDGSPNYSSTIKAGFVHHTASANGYSAAEVPKILRGIYAYHTKSNGWSDIGYNFLVDRFGRLWEGRYGGISKPVIGAHTGGFNTDTFAVSAIGNYDKVAAPAAMTDAISRVLAWKLSLHYRNPVGQDDADVQRRRNLALRGRARRSPSTWSPHIATWATRAAPARSCTRRCRASARRSRGYVGPGSSVPASRRRPPPRGSPRA